MKLRMASLITVFSIFGVILLSFQNCAEHEFSVINAPLSERANGVPDVPDTLGTPDTPERSAPPVCNDFTNVKSAMKLIIAIDNTAAANTFDPQKKFRQTLLKNLVGKYSSKTNFSWSLIAFDDQAATDQVGHVSGESAKFANNQGMMAALNAYEKLDSKGSSAAFKPTLALIRQTVEKDVDFKNDPANVNYVILLISATGPSDFGSPADVAAAAQAAQSLAALSPGHLAFNTVYFGVKDTSIELPSTELVLSKMAESGAGHFSSFTEATDLLNPLTAIDSFELGSLAKGPEATCHSAADPVPPGTPPVCPSATREVVGADETSSITCGLDGKKSVTKAAVITEKCSSESGSLVWSEVSRNEVVRKEGTCEGQSCRLPDGSVLPDKGSIVLYSTSSPTGSCTDVSESRTCHNGTLSGSASFTHKTCRNGCGAFGPDGTIRTGVVIGSTTQPVTCPFGESGVKDVIESLADQTCADGKVLQSNERLGKVLEKGACPTYQWTGTDKWGNCSADCGGQQMRVYECRDDKGVAQDAQRCRDSAPLEARACDGNPGAVAREESSTVQEQAGSTTEKCPKDQIGVVVQIRDVTTKKSYACIDHQVQLEKTSVNHGAWITEKYCRDYVAHRCSQDSLNNAQAEGRYQWMLKCADQVPAIEKFLTDFKDVKISGKFTISSAGTRHLYPTFMNNATTPEKPWIAPKSADGSCEVPKTAYIASVCLSSCATPEQQILAEADAKLGLRYMSFVDSLTKNAGRVGTLHARSTMTSKDVAKTAVEQWVTEMIDTEHDIVEFRLKSGQILRLTPNHPVLAADGTMKLAEKFQVGESLVRLGGELDPIVQLNNVKFHGKVYNLFVKSADVKKNIVVTNGYLNGTAFFQNEGAKNMNRSLFRKNLIRGALVK